MAYEDLLKDTSEPGSESKKFIVTITDLDVNTVYPIQFRWKYSDGGASGWSAAKILVTPSEISPATPSKINAVGGAGFITLTWDGKTSSNVNMTNIHRIDVYIDGYPFDALKPATDFIVAGTKTVTAPAGTYVVSAFAVSQSGTLSAFAKPTTVDVTEIGVPIIDAVDPSAPSIKAGLASIIVSWDGKTSLNTDFASGSFAAANIYIGTASNFIPSENNRVHALNFANGTNQVSIGVGTVINKETGALLSYGTSYYVKLGTINPAGIGTGNYIPSSPTNISVLKLPASEISTGILTADNSITAGIEDGQRVVISGSETPFIIYGTDGETKLLEYLAEGSEGILSIKGSGTFSGDISAASGTFSGGISSGFSSAGSITGVSASLGSVTYTSAAHKLQVGDIITIEGVSPSQFNLTKVVINSITTDTFSVSNSATGSYVSGGTVYKSTFSVSSNGVVRAEAGIIGGWTITDQYLSSGTLQFNSTNSAIYVGATNGNHIKISTSGGIQHLDSTGGPTGKFALAPNGTLTISGSFVGGSITGTEITGSSFTQSGDSYIKMDSINTPGEISFYTSGYETPGYVSVLQGGGLLPSMHISPPTSSGIQTPFISASGGEFASTMSLYADLVQIGSASSSSEINLNVGANYGAQVSNNFGVLTSIYSIRNIKATSGDGPPSSTDGIVGDIVLFYT